MMAGSHATAARCGTCGGDLPVDGAPCPACAVIDDEEAVVLAETVEHLPCDAADADCLPTPLWMRLCVALVYLLVSAACGYGSLTFFDGNFTTSSDWVFGAMAIGLALVALLGVKESLFPSDWRPE